MSAASVEGKMATSAKPAGPRLPPSFENEIGRALSYEKGLAVKALIALTLVAVIVVIRLLGL